MDGTATIGREGKGGSKGEGVREGERDDWVGVREKERGGASWREDKESRCGGVKLMQMMTLSVLQQVNEDENK